MISDLIDKEESPEILKRNEYIMHELIINDILGCDQ